jgi:hypothetical protein
MSVDLDSLDPEVRLLAFWLQEKIYTKGIDGVHFMRDARLWAEENAADVTANEITKELKKL